MRNSPRTPNGCLRLAATLCLISTAATLILPGCGSIDRAGSGQKNEPATREQEPLKVGIAPYQDVAMLVTEKDLDLERKYGTKLELVTLAWEDIPSAIASAGQTVDVGFVGLTDYLSKIEKMNGGEKDPIIFLYPAMLFRGGGFISFNEKVPEINARNIQDLGLVRKFLEYKIGAQRTSCFQMVIYMLARRAGVKAAKLQLIDTTLNDGLLAAMNGSLDMAAAGLPQRTEALKRHGRVVLSIDTLGVGEINGFACKQSTYRKRKKEIENLIKIWFACTDYVTTDPDHHSASVLAYLKKNASTQYTLAEYKRTIAEEYFPKSVAEAEKTLVSEAGRYSLGQQVKEISAYLVESGAARSRPQAPETIEIAP